MAKLGALLGRLKALPAQTVQRLAHSSRLPRLPKLGSLLGRGQGSAAADAGPRAGLRRLPRRVLRFVAGELTRARGVGIVLGCALVALAAWLDTTRPEAENLIDARIPKVRVAVTSLDGQPGAEGGDGQGAEAAGAPEGPPIAPDATVEMTPAPAVGLYEETELGLLPRIGPDGQQPWQAYARPFPRETTRGLVAIVITHMGLSGATMQPVMDKLPAAVTLAFKSYSNLLDPWLERARTRGHETLLMVPMEPLDYPQSDPGRHALLTFLKPTENMNRLLMALGQTSGYVGITSISGSRFGATPTQLRPILQTLKDRGLLFLDSAAAPGYRAAQTAAEVSMAWAYVDRVIDRDPGRAAIDAELDALVVRARETGAAVGRGEPLLTTIERLALWIPRLPDLGLALAPVSAVVGRQRLADRIASSG